LLLESFAVLPVTFRAAHRLAEPVRISGEVSPWLLKDEPTAAQLLIELQEMDWR
jgi:hypothetical protein